MRFLIILSCLFVLPLTACGIKPDSVKPPPGAEENDFPGTYPDIRTDPRPYAPPSY